MNINYYIHQLNNTEIGKTNTNDTYIAVPKALVADLWFLPQGEFDVMFKQDGMSYKIKYEIVANGEYRITKLGRIFRAANSNAGDLIQLENCDNQLYVDFVSRHNVLVFVCKKGAIFQCLNEDRLKNAMGVQMPCWWNGAKGVLEIKTDAVVRPRKDSDRTVNTYRLEINGVSVVTNKDAVYNLFLLNGIAVISEARRDIVSKIEWNADYE